MELYVILVIVIILVLIIAAIVVAVFVTKPVVTPLTPIVPVTPTATPPASTVTVTDVSDGCCKPCKKSSSSSTASSSTSYEELCEKKKKKRPQRKVAPGDDYTLGGTAPATRVTSSSRSTSTTGDSSVDEEEDVAIETSNDHTLGDTPTPPSTPRHTKKNKKPKKVSSQQHDDEDTSDFTAGGSYQLRIYKDGMWRTVAIDIDVEKLQHSGIRLYGLSNSTIYRIDDSGKTTPYIGKGKFPFDGYIDDFYVRDGGMFIKSGDDYYKLMTDGLVSCNIFSDACLHEIHDRTVYSYHSDGSLTLDGVEVTTNFVCPLDTTQSLHYDDGYLYYVTSDGRLCRSKVLDEQLDESEEIISHVKLYTISKGEYAYINTNNRLYIGDEHIGSAATAKSLCLQGGQLYVA